MRLSCEYKTDKVPVAHKMMFVSLIKSALAMVDEEYYESLYNFDEKSNKKIKPFSFSVQLKEFKMQEGIFKIEDKIVFNVTTPDYEFGIKLYNGLLNIEEFPYRDFKLKKIRINLIKEKNITSDIAVFKTMSPLCIKNKRNIFIDPSHPDYEKELNYIVDKSLLSYRGYGLKVPLKFQEVLMKKVVVKEEITAFKDKTKKQIFYVNAFSGIFKLTGDVEDLNFIYKAGIGFRRSQGFGTLDVV
ncbi:CRISPR-associated endoribonuclease Cas6 [Clostridium sp. 19966]|uniref:CRISPR-associated endoribonuclease Cas6 n=1 Tax=Clostridium sp. 19966 TaxID=2768166 RepID=UPI0028DD7166|nr:CRISPR-associated endoribonuclease Cas6 [Clostridium sp. 19966]MDT8719673.1 CRISPR-associated endoribonuclease Cas6 [Clostridium sp. 19966]